jgi:arsenate reductase
LNGVRILFVCSHHGARARIAAHFARTHSAGAVEALSSCFEEGRIGPLPIAVMKELGVDISADPPATVFERHRNNEVFDYVITLCYEATTKQCPIFRTNVDDLYARQAEHRSWSITGFKTLKGSEEERLAAAREIRDRIEAQVRRLLEDLGVDAGSTP